MRRFRVGHYLKASLSDGYVRLAFDEIRQTGAGLPRVT